jgi:hypothetical protein
MIGQKSRWGKRQSAVCPPVSQVREGRLGLMYDAQTTRQLELRDPAVLAAS